MMRIPKTIALLLGLALLLSACGGASTTPTTSPTTGSPSPTGTDEVHFIGLPSANVDAIFAEIKAALNMDLKINQEDFVDSISGDSGWGQAIVVEGTGNDFAGPAITAQILATILEAKGYQEDMAYAADGPTGTQRGFTKDKGLALIDVNWKPADDVVLDPNQPIEAQSIVPEKMLYSVKVLLATKPF
jgi:ABC-type glycerol-3-phosphate transport system substrate-binding protein